LEKTTSVGDFQGNAGINYPSMDVSYTRSYEHKHFTPWENHEKTIVFHEFSKETNEGDVPYYPKQLARDKKLLESYMEEARADNGVYFLGRLATYRYMDMDDVIDEALSFSKRYLYWRANRNIPAPLFSNI